MTKAAKARAGPRVASPQTDRARCQVKCRVRCLFISNMVWLRHQPTSELSLWFRERVKRNGGRGRKTVIVALARKLLVALWKFSSSGVVIEGAMMKTA